MTKIRGFLRLIFDVVEEIASLIIAIALLIYSNLILPSNQGNTNLLINGILLIVGLLALSNLRDRLYRFRNIQFAIEGIQHEIHEKTIIKNIGPDDFFIGRNDSYNVYLSSASDIAILGITLSGTIQTYRLTLQKRLEAGSKIKIIILDPDSDDALRQLVLRSWSNTANPEYYKGSLRFITELITNIANTPLANGSLEIGYLPFVPSFGMTLLKHEEISSVAFVEIYQHLTDGSPGFFVDKNNAPKTFQFYQTQLEKMWGVCRKQRIV